jgi:hypothetical protein
MSAILRLHTDPAAEAAFQVEQGLVGAVLASITFDDAAAWSKVQHVAPEDFRDFPLSEIWAAISDSGGKLDWKLLAARFPDRRERGGQRERPDVRRRVLPAEVVGRSG